MATTKATTTTTATSSAGGDLRSILVTVLPIVMMAMYSMFIYLTLIDPKTLWATHYPDQPIDPVFSYSTKAKGSAITGLLVGLIVSYTKPLSERQLPFLSCLVFQGLALSHHGWCYFTEPTDYFVDSAMHFQYVVMHTFGCLVFGFLLQEAVSASPSTNESKSQ